MSGGWNHHRSLTGRATGPVGKSWMAVLMCCLALAFGSTEALGQAETEPWYAVVGAEHVSIHAGRAPEYDRLATLDRGDVVLVRHVNTFGWASIAPPAGLTAFVRQQEVAEGDEKGTVQAIGRVPVYYPISEDPVQCFRKYRVDPDTVMRVIETIDTGERGIYYKVEMPRQMDVYALAGSFRKATDAEVKAWQATEKAQRDAARANAKPMEIKPAPKQEEASEPTTGPESTSEPANQTQTPPAQQPVEEESASPAQNEEQAQDESTIPAARLEPMPGAEETAETMPQDGGAESNESENAVESTPEFVEPARIETSGPSLTDLEAMYEQHRAMPIAKAETAPLLAAYQEFAQRESTHPSEARVAQFRIDLLQIRRDYQVALEKLDEAENRAEQQVTRPEIGRLVDAQGRPIYAVTGVLQPSNVFDGRRLPLLYRVQDPITGRTIVYLDPGADESRDHVDRLLGSRVGVNGDIEKRANWNIDVVRQWRIESLEDSVAETETDDR